MNKDIFIYSSVGSDDLEDSYKSKVFDSWEINKFDSGCTIYKDSLFAYRNYFKTVLYNSGYKFPNFFNFNNRFKILDKYKYIAILDDDLLFNQNNSMTQIVYLMKKYNISLCSLSNDNRGKKTFYNVMHKNNKKVIDITNFCEMGCMIFDRKFLRVIQTTYYTSYRDLKDWGFDWWICSMANEFKLKIGIVKYLSFYNPMRSDRDCGKDDWFQYKNTIQFIQPKVYNSIQC